MYSKSYWINRYTYDVVDKYPYSAELEPILKHYDFLLKKEILNGI